MYVACLTSCVFLRSNPHYLLSKTSLISHSFILKLFEDKKPEEEIRKSKGNVNALDIKGIKHATGINVETDLLFVSFDNEAEGKVWYECHMVSYTNPIWAMH